MKPRLVMFLIALILLGTVVSAYAWKQNWTWEPPTQGAQAVSYVVQLQEEGEEWEDAKTVDETSVQLNFPKGKFRIRVAAVSASGEQGPWSEPSDWLLDKPLPPGKPKGGKVLN